MGEVGQLRRDFPGPLAQAISVSRAADAVVAVDAALRPRSPAHRAAAHHVHHDLHAAPGS